MSSRATSIDPPGQIAASPTGDGERACVLSHGELVEEVVGAWEKTQRAVLGHKKDSLRSLHLAAKRGDKGVDVRQLSRDLTKLSSYFPEPSSIDPARIDPELVLVPDSTGLEARLFRLLRGYWSMPFSKGYGRRLRFLVVDRHHQALVGIIGLQSPAADLHCRDKYFGADKADKLTVANTTMDAYTVGASPTYAPLLGGKLVAGLIHSERIRQAYWRSYGSKKTLLDGQRLQQPLLAVTTTSAFGRSSIYNRLKFGEDLLAKPLGYTKGYGTVHLETLYPHLVSWLKDRSMHIPAGFGNGPKVRWQNIIHALKALGIPREYLNHGIQREVFIFEFASNLATLHSNQEFPALRHFDDDAWGEYWKHRWCLKRVATRPDWNEFNARDQLERGISQFS